MNHIGTQTLRTPRLLLRRFVASDAQSMYENWCSDPEVTKYLTWPTHRSIEDTLPTLMSWIEGYSDPRQYQWAICFADDPVHPIGSISAVGLSDRTESAEIGYCLGKNWWVQGVMSEALSAVIDFFFSQVGALRVSACHDPNNPRSGGVMCHCGMTYEGTLRRADRNNQGICDVSIYGILAAEWSHSDNGSRPMKSILAEHLQRYPLAEPQDFLKLLYQSEFGGGHLIADPARALEYLNEELASVAGESLPESIPPLEDIGSGLMRLHLQSCTLRPETVLGLFLQTCKPRGEQSRLSDKLDLLERTISLPCLSEAVARFRANGCPAQRHSETYRAAYHPAYRLVPAEVKRFLPLLARIDALLRERPFVRIAIDGPCASGKSTLGAWLRDVYSANLIPMDDFFLPFARKTPERLSEPGGNVDHERFFAEVASRPKDAAFDYRPFDCGTQSLAEPVHVPMNPLTIVEGSYSLHPALRDGYDLKIFLDVDPEIQSARILVRNGEAMHRRFVNEWIPMENAYFAAHSVREIADLTF